MLEGLEASEITWSQINDDRRIDAEYFQKRYLEEASDISHHSLKMLGDLAFITDGQHGYHEVDETSPIHMLTAQSARGWFADTSGADRIAKWVDDNNKRSSLAANDLILSTRGTVGLCALVVPDVLPANIDQDVARVHIKTKEVIPAYLLTFLNSKYGQDWLARNQSGMVQQGVSLAKLRDMPVPLVSRDFQLRIKGVVEGAFEQLEKSQRLYAEAETLLLTELGLKDWTPEEPLAYEARSTDAFAAGRLDAEYFSPRIQDLITHLHRSGASIEAVASLRKEHFTPNPKNFFSYIEIGSVLGHGEANAEQVWGAEAPSRATWIVRPGDVIVSTVRPLRRLSAIISTCQSGYVCSSGFAVLHPKKVSAEFLLVYLRLKAIAELMNLHTTASMYPAISVENLLAMPCPRPSVDAHAKVTELVQSSFSARAEANLLLEKAKRAVEIAIEDGEEAARDYLDGKAYVASAVLPAMTEQHKYFSVEALRRRLADQKLNYRKETVTTYISRLKGEGRIFSAGRGWYSSIERAFLLDREPVATLVAALEERFPRLAFSCWSTGQLNPYLHHGLGKTVLYVHVDRDAMSSVFDALQDTDYRVYLNPTRREANKGFVADERTLVIRPLINHAPVDGRYARIEKVLVDLHVELESIPLIEVGEFREAAQGILAGYRIDLAKLITYATQRKVDWTGIFLDPDAVIAGTEKA